MTKKRHIGKEQPARHFHKVKSKTLWQISIQLLSCFIGKYNESVQHCYALLKHFKKFVTFFSSSVPYAVSKSIGTLLEHQSAVKRLIRKFSMHGHGFKTDLSY